MGVNSLAVMVWVLLLGHVVGVGLAIAAGRVSMRAGLLTAAIAPTATAIWAAARLIDGAEPLVTEVTWVDGLDLVFRFKLDSIALMMALLVSGIGALVFIYATGYFSPGAAGGTRFPASLLAFSAAMLGLVLSDSVWSLFIFWELTSVTSFLLVGFKNTSADVRTAARRALMITGAGGLVLLVGLLILTDIAGTSVLSDLPAVSGRSATIAAILVMIGAATKSAQVPFHVWLPGAMAAPTPVSAYLHSATMVKAGVLLVAVLGPALGDVDAWRVLGMTFGIVSMFWGAIGALRQHDGKLLLAWGTISQLGLLFTLYSLGTPKATFAATAIVVAHALFKAALFLIIGEVDVRTGTRDISKLGGLWRTMPITFACAVLAAASMAGAPPLLGFMAKEAAIEATLGLSGTERVILVGAVVGGSVLTVAYTLRFVLTVFGPGPDTSADTFVTPRRTAMTVPIVILSLLGLIGYVWVGPVNRLVSAAATELNDKASKYELIPWPGLKTAFIISMAVLAVGAVLGVVFSRRLPTEPAAVGARIADRTIDGVLGIAPRITAVVQHGSLPIYLLTSAAVAALAALPFLWAGAPDGLVAWNSPLEMVLAVGIIVSAAAGTFVSSRLGAALTLGAVGIGMSGLFVLYGAPDLALTQLLVETIIVVGFVLGLGQLRNRFPAASDAWRGIRITVSVIGGLTVAAALAAASAAPSGTAPIDELTDGAVDDGGGKNVVNVILTDVRALDTLGEVVVLATVAIGVLALAKVRREELSR